MTRDNYEERIAELKDRYEERINELQDRIYELTGKPKLQPPHPRWMPEIDGIYYYIYSKEAHNTYWGDTTYNIGNYSVGNVFKTKEEAEFAVERLKALAEMREWAGNYNDPYAIAYIGFNNQDVQIIVVDNMGYSSFGEMRFATSKDAKNCINEVGEDRIKKYYFMVPEGEQ